MVKITSDELIKFADEFRLDKPGAKLTSVSLSKYLEEKGLEIQPRYINRKIGDYIKRIKNDRNAVKRTVVVYNPLNVDQFIKANNTPDKLRAALLERDKYYSEISASAAEIFRENEKVRKEMESLKEEIQLLKEKENRVNIKAGQIKEKDETIKKLKAFIDQYINEDIANALLEKEGVFEPVMKVLSKDTVENSVISADTNIRNLKVNKLINEIEKD